MPAETSNHSTGTEVLFSTCLRRHIASVPNANSNTNGCNNHNPIRRIDCRSDFPTNSTRVSRDAENNFADQKRGDGCWLPLPQPLPQSQSQPQPQPQRQCQPQSIATVR
eukprot:jgi/Psemu1/6790/gm1.6790_g